MARMLANVSRDELAKLSGVSARTIGNYEAGSTQMLPAYLASVRRELERLGVEFLPRDGVARRAG